MRDLDAVEGAKPRADEADERCDDVETTQQDDACRERPDDPAADGEAEPPMPSDDVLARKSVREMSPREIGGEGERLAAEFLARRGYKVLERNWRCAAGEVDIVCRDGDVHVLVEVKTRLALGDDAQDMPELAVDRRKRERYRKLALLYLATHPFVESLRFDVIALNIVAERTARLRHLIGAFQWTE
jgi:putative endonuclease